MLTHSKNLRTPKTRTFAFVTYLLLLSILELLAYKQKGIFSIIASRIWLISAMILILLFLFYAIASLINDIKVQKYSIISGFGLLLVAFCSFIGNLGYSDINADATQQIAAGLDSFHLADMNYTGVAFLGYANRQYVLAAIPSALFGRNVPALHLGFAYPFLIGLWLLFLELRQYLKEHNIPEKYALIPIYAFPCFPFISEYYMNFEQAITPVALTMIGIALFMRFCRKQDFISSAALAWIGCFGCGSYTPALASVGLLLCFYSIYLVKFLLQKQNDHQKNRTQNKWYASIVIAASMINIIAFFLATVSVGRSDRIMSFRKDTSLFKCMTKAWTEFFGNANANFLGLFTGIILLYLLLSLFGKLTFQDFAISAWVLGVIFLSSYLAGYTTYDKSWILQRNMIIIPVLTIRIFIIVCRFLKRKNRFMNKPGLLTLLVIFSMIGVWTFNQPHQSFKYFRYIQPMKYAIECAVESMDEIHKNNTDEFNIVLCTDNPLQTNISDYTQYFFPNAHAISCPVSDYPDIPDNHLFTIYISENKSLSDYVSAPVTEKCFSNPRYHTNCYWYLYVN